MNEAPTLAALGNSVRLHPPTLGVTKGPVLQTIELVENDVVIASGIWFTHGTDGFVQLLDIRVESGFQRRGVGTRLFKILQKEAALFFRSRGERLRRITAHTEQKSQIIARAFFSKNGFHHVQTLPNTLKKQDILVYLLGCD